MAAEQLQQRANPNRSHSIASRGARWARPFAVATAVGFVISAVFPIAAGLSKDTASFPKWWGPLDVGVAFVLGLLATATMVLAQGQVDKAAEDATYRAYRILVHGIFALLVVCKRSWVRRRRRRSRALSRHDHRVRGRDGRFRDNLRGGDRVYPSVTNAPRMAPAATPLIDPTMNQPQARARGICAWI